MTSSTEHDLRTALLLGAIWDLSDDAMCCLDADGRVTSWNRSAERIWGFEANEVIAQPFRSLFPEHLHREAEGESGYAHGEAPCGAGDAMRSQSVWHCLPAAVLMVGALVATFTETVPW